MVKFTEEHKKEMSSNYFGEGIFKVKIGMVELGETEKGQEYIEFTLLDDDGREGSSRVWFTTDAAINYSINIIRGIFVHNAPEGKKDEIREKVDKLPDTASLAKACQMLVGKECWYSVFKSDRTYTGKDGQLKNSYDRNIYGYEPKPKLSEPQTINSVDERVEADKANGVGEAPAEEIEQPFGF